MEDVIEKTTKTVNHAEKDLLTSIALKDPTFQELENKLAKFRFASQDLIFLDLRLAYEKAVETRLWDAHGKVNSRFRKALAVFREGEGKGKHVERRKLEKLYLDFTKSSTRFYRGYIQRLASNFSGIPEVESIACKFKLDTLSASDKVICDGPTRNIILGSCYSTLVRLGDLSRYRETELQMQKRNWGPANGYYDLAKQVDPTSGMPYNQMAVIALSDQDHLQATYYLCRALCVSRPAPTAQGNLDIELKKIIKHLREGTLPMADSLSIRFLLFHAQQSSLIASGRDLVESGEIIDRLKKEVSDGAAPNVPTMCLINIAMQWLADKRASGSSSSHHVCRKLLQVNVETLLALMTLSLADMQTESIKEDVSAKSDANGFLTLPALTGRLLPQLRIYSGWLQSNHQALAKISSPGENVLTTQLWKSYATLMSFFVATFTITKIPEIDHILPEDQEIKGFLPISDSVHERRTEGKLRARTESPTGTSSLNYQEDLYRIKDLVRDAVYLVTDKDKSGQTRVPLAYSKGQFVYLGSDITSEHVSPGLREGGSSARLKLDAESALDGTIHSTPVQGLIMSPPAGGGINMSFAGDSQADGSGAHTLQNAQVEFQTTPTSVRQMYPPASPSFPSSYHQQQSSHPILPTIWNTVFTPRPGETPGSSPRQHMAAVRLTPPFTISGGGQQQQRSSIGSIHDQGSQQQTRDIQMRMSPPRQQSQLQSYIPSSMSYHGTPGSISGGGPLISSVPRAAEDDSRMLSPWQNTSSSSPIRQGLSAGIEIPRPLPQAALFGAIGEARRNQARTPTSGQGG